MFAVGMVNNHPIYCDQQIDFDSEILIFGVGFFQVPEQVLVVGVDIATKLAGTRQMTEAFADTPFVADRAVELSVLDRMDGRFAGRVIRADDRHCYLTFDGLLCHCLFRVWISEGGRQSVEWEGRELVARCLVNVVRMRYYCDQFIDIINNNEPKVFETRRCRVDRAWNNGGV